MSINNPEYKIAIIGPQDSVSGFQALGVETLAANTPAEALERLRQVKTQTADMDSNVTYAVVCIIENLLAGIDQVEYAKVTAGALPAVVILPGPDGAQGFALNRLRRLAEQAVGSAII